MEVKTNQEGALLTGPSSTSETHLIQFDRTKGDHRQEVNAPTQNTTSVNRTPTQAQHLTWAVPFPRPDPGLLRGAHL